MNDNITEINKDTFWALIQEAKDTCGQDTDAWAKYMIDRLAGLGPDQSLMFLNYMDAYKDLSFRYGLWDAAKIFRVDGCSDDSFSYFRSWLIVQGKDVYMAALADPDSLADVEPYADCFFETAGYVGAYAYKRLTGEYAFEHLDYDYLLALENELVKDIHYKEGIEYPRDWKALPLLSFRDNEEADRFFSVCFTLMLFDFTWLPEYLPNLWSSHSIGRAGRSTSTPRRCH